MLYAVIGYEKRHRHKVGIETMALDSSVSIPTTRGGVAEVGYDVPCCEPQILDGENFSGQEEKTCPEIGKYTDTNWGYLFVHNRKAENLVALIEKRGHFKTFIHKTVRFKIARGKGKEEACPTISGLVFIQGNVSEIQKFFQNNIPQYHLVNDCSTHETAVIPDEVMQPFMRIVEADPVKVRFLLNPISKYAEGNTLVQVMTGPLAGLQGYIIRIDRDRKLVMKVGDMTMAIGGVHKEHFENVEQLGKELKAKEKVSKRDTERRLTEMQGSIDKTEKALAEYRTAYPFRFTSDPKECAGFWAIRSGIFPTVGSMRKLGTTCMIEDIAFHIEDLPDAIDEVSALLDKHGYDDSCIYGHVLEGNVHFIINQKLDSEKEIARYKAMLNDIVTLVTDKYDGSLKAEHGTGRNMAPFVEHEWGTKAYNYMKRVKELLDPENILNRGVIFNDDKECSYKSFKSLPVISPKAGASPEAEAAFAKANKCIECGFCEPNCMSYGFTLSARTRITLLRKLEELRSTGADPDFLESLEKKFKYYADETCAGDGLCSTSCPMGINTADITHEVRRKNPGSLAWNTGDFAAKHLSVVKSMLRGTLDLAYTGRSIVGEPCMSFLGKALHGAGLPLWTESLPKSFKLKNIESQASDLKVVYFPSCINQTMGLDRASKGMRPLVEEMKSLLEKAGYEVIFPENRESLCCGTIWKSKGMADIAERKVRELEEALYKASCGGRYPVVCDQSPCLHRMKQCITKVKLYDSVEFIWDFLREKLEFHQINEPIALHVTCSTKHMKLDKMIYDLARLCSPDVLIPEGVGCCGFAGDKGMMTPELNAHGLRHLREQVQAKGIRTGYSNSRTCEIGLQTNSGIPYRSIVYLVNACTTRR